MGDHIRFENRVYYLVAKFVHSGLANFESQIVPEVMFAKTLELTNEANKALEFTLTMLARQSVNCY